MKKKNQLSEFQKNNGNRRHIDIPLSAVSAEGKVEPAPINLDKRIKRHVVGARHDFFAVAPPGHESLTRKELEKLCPELDFGKPAKGGVTFSGRLPDLYQANLHLRTAGRILMRLARFKAPGFDQLEKRSQALAWSLYLPPGEIPRIHVTAHHSRLYHSQAVADRIRSSIADHWTAMAIQPVSSKDQTLFVRLTDDVATFSLDSSGENLYRRGLKTHTGRAPLRETLASIILHLADYNPRRPLLDPMCGAGTFSLEAALTAKAVAPGLDRRFAFMRWPAFRPRQWHHLTKIAAQNIIRLERPLIWASDIDEAACAGLRDCIGQNGLDDAVRVDQRDFFSLRPDEFYNSPGLIVLNPPYGRRLQAKAPLSDLYRRIAGKLQQDFKGWQTALLVPDEHLARSLGLHLKASALSHGGLKLTLLTGRIA